MSEPTPSFTFAIEQLQPGLSLLEASAGTGKTFTIEGLVTRFLAQGKVEIGNILAMTFTEAAAADLRRRVRARLVRAEGACAEGVATAEDPALAYLAGEPQEEQALANQRLRLALKYFEEAQISTIHGFCSRLLAEYALECALPFEFTIEERTSHEKFQEIANRFWREHLQGQGTEANALAFAELAELPATLAKLRRHQWPPVWKAAPGLDFSRVRDRVSLRLSTLLTAWQAEREHWLALAEANSKAMKKKWREGAPASFLGLDQAAKDAALNPGLVKVLRGFSHRRLLKSCNKGGLEALAEPSPFVKSVEALLELLDQVRPTLIQEGGKYACRQLREERSRSSQLDFDDLLEEVLLALSGSNTEALREALRERYQLILIDEFQDTDPTQWEIVRAVQHPGARTYLIGDPKQAIYGFRGADLQTYFRASATVGNRAQLTRNWRSVPGLVDAVNHLFASNPAAFGQVPIRFHPVSPARADKRREFCDAHGKDGGPPLRARLLEKGTIAAATETCAQDIHRLLASAMQLKGRALEASDIAVIGRTGKQVEMMRTALLEHGIPAISSQDVSVYRGRAAEEITWLMRAAQGGRGEGALRRLLAGPCFRASEAAIARLTNGECDAAWQARLAGWAQLWRDHGIAALLRHALLSAGIGETLASQAGGDRLLTDFSHLTELLHDQERRSRATPTTLLEWLETRRRDPAVDPGNAQSQRLEGDSDAVKVLTAHRSKGLEFPVVFLPFTWVNPQPPRGAAAVHFGASQQLHLVLPDTLNSDLSEADEAAAHALEKETESEEARLLYVAMTRAEHRCTLYLPESGGGRKSPLARLVQAETGAELPTRVRELAQGLPETIQIFDEQALDQQQTRPSQPPGHGSAVTQPALARTPVATPRHAPRMITSFSSLMEGGQSERPDRDASTATPVPQGSGTQDDRVLLPPGAASGLLLHSLLENLDFADAEARGQAVEAALASRPDKATPELRLMLLRLIDNLLATPLDAGEQSFSLGSIGLADRLDETGFSLPVSRLTSAGLKSTLGTLLPEELELWEKLRFGAVDGYLRGYIDCIVRAGGKFYLIDWKSNWLGQRSCDYRKETIQASILTHGYRLQYHLYAVALTRYLRNRLPSFLPERDFGGCIYVYLRGFRETPNPQSFFYDNPSPEKLRELETALHR